MHIRGTFQALSPLPIIKTSDPEEIRSAFFPERRCKAACLNLSDDKLAEIRAARDELISHLPEGYNLSMLSLDASYDTKRGFRSEHYGFTTKHPAFYELRFNKAAIPTEQATNLLEAFTSGIHRAFPISFNVSLYGMSESGWHRDKATALGCTFPLEKPELTTQMPGIFKNKSADPNTAFFFDNSLWHSAPPESRSCLVAFGF